MCLPMHVAEAVADLQPCDTLTAPLPRERPASLLVLACGALFVFILLFFYTLYMFVLLSIYVYGSPWTEPKDTLWGYERIARADMLTRSHANMTIRRSAICFCRP